MDRKTTSEPSAQPDTFRPVVFLWPVNEPVDVAALARAAGKAAGVAVCPISRTSRDRRAGAALAVDTLGEALDLLHALVHEAASAPQPVRIIADFGPATDARGAASDAAISRLSGASDMIGLPASVAIATLTFAARARAEAGGLGGSFIPIGRTAIATAEKGGDGRPLPSRDVYAISFQGRTSGKRAAGKRRPR